MKITPTMPGNRPTATTAGSSQSRKSTATTATTLSADDITWRDCSLPSKH
ncbi:hypothetical protein ECZU06_22640 [Escherichia coli]|nr:hypothetical protein ECZU06_22640 [Escherichia coli]